MSGPSRREWVLGAAAAALLAAAAAYFAFRPDGFFPMIEADVSRATQGGARSTPTFFIGSEVISGAERIEAFREAVDKAKSALPK